MIADFTVEEMSLVASVQQRENGKGKMERMPCILALVRLLVKGDVPDEIRDVLSDTVEKLSMMTEQEYSGYDFSVDLADIGV